MSEKFGEGGYDEHDGSRSSLVEQGDFMVPDNEQNDLMVDAAGDHGRVEKSASGVSQDNMEAYHKYIVESQRRTESFSHHPRVQDAEDTIKQMQRRAAPAPSSQLISRRSAIDEGDLDRIGLAQNSKKKGFLER